MMTVEETNRTLELEQLGEQAMQSRHWRWMPGMQNVAGCRVIRAYSEGGARYEVGIPKGYTMTTVVYTPCPPDLEDPATLGCLMSLVQEAWGGKWYPKAAIDLEPAGLVQALMNAPDPIREALTGLQQGVEKLAVSIDQLGEEVKLHIAAQQGTVTREA